MTKRDIIEITKLFINAFLIIGFFYCFTVVGSLLFVPQ